MRVMLAICRKTFGWHKTRDRLSLSQLEELTGMSRQGVLNGIESCLARGWLRRYDSGGSYEYEVNIEEQVVNEVDHPTQMGSQRSRPVVVNEVDTQKKYLKKEDEAAADAAKSAIDTYSRNIGLATPIIADDIRAAVARHGAPTVCDAIAESVRSGARSWSYVAAVLDAWATYGRENCVGRQRAQWERANGAGRRNGARAQQPQYLTAEEVAEWNRRLEAGEI